MSADQIARLNASQVDGRFHPFTCPNRGDGEHREFNGDRGALVATRRGWICPWCDYTQNWAYSFMADAPDFDMLRGAAPGATGADSSEAFVRKLRDEWGER